MKSKTREVSGLTETVLEWDNLHSNSKLAIGFLESLGGARALSISIMLRYGEYDQIVSLAIDPMDYIDEHDFRSDYVATEYLSKSKWLPLSFDREEVAYQKFLDAEIQCSEANVRIKSLWESPLREDSEISVLLHLASVKISLILGKLPMPEKFDFSFGPGSTSSVSGDKTSMYEKLRALPECTSNCLPLVHLVEEYPSWLESLRARGCKASRAFASVIQGSKLLFVPKSAKTDRAICVEPHLNSFFQMGIGRYLRRRLRNWGCDLQDQGINQWLAYGASLGGDLMTVDLKSASDTIPYNLVLDLLPKDWFMLLDCSRSPGFTYRGQYQNFSKFSSMGNGYTFELETLLFLALTQAVCEYKDIPYTEVSVYGDDIICPSSIRETLERIFAFCGFTFNTKKSFSNSYFRESCGAHWFRGLDCKPIYFKQGVRHVLDLIKHTNAIRRFSHRNYKYGCDGRFRKVWSYSVNLLASKGFILRGSEGYGDGFIVCNKDEIPHGVQIRRLPHGHEGWRVSSVVEKSVGYKASDPAALYSYALHMAGSEPLSEIRVQPESRNGAGTSYDTLIDYRRRSRVTIGKISIQRWIDLGPWL